MLSAVKVNFFEADRAELGEGMELCDDLCDALVFCGGLGAEGDSSIHLFTLFSVNFSCDATTTDLKLMIFFSRRSHGLHINDGRDSSLDNCVPVSSSHCLKRPALAEEKSCFRWTASPTDKHKRQAEESFKFPVVVYIFLGVAEAMQWNHMRSNSLRSNSRFTKSPDPTPDRYGKMPTEPALPNDKYLNNNIPGSLPATDFNQRLRKHCNLKVF